ncbi:hypothetical protein J7F02_05555 [Streptomyces sp. ISL-112]|uniref:hypothetical protein n=1 Tax=unclassified Streptomyces TaxID=2593676 RepID=UPI001BE5E448|nr:MULTISPECIES: hypothetical protein [unclassified Streptomyces]MBT2425166.1 hypothetical protein [Streptomyces sp. ISL-112]MBT2461958.1 hypothetical protein [Streptomyces sp. ISL-63]
MDIPMTLPLDHDGFLRRECPHCVIQFKWHPGPANEEAEQQPTPTTYYCPLCGQPAGPDSWWTQEQLDYAEGLAAPAAMREVEQGLRDTFKGASSKHVKFSVKGGSDTPNAPAPLTEPDDMVIVASPCHKYEPVKVPGNASGPLHCLVCGQAFAV